MSETEASASRSHALLPMELIDDVIDFLHGDYDSLKNCAMSCKEFLPRCRFNRFQSVTLDVQNITRFATLLQTSNDVAFYVHELVVIAKERPIPPGSIRPCISWLEVHLSKLGEKLPYVHKLEIRDSDALREVVFRGFSSVTTLILKRCIVSNVDHYIRILNCFPSLQLVFNLRVNMKYPNKTDIVSNKATFLSLTSMEFIQCSFLFGLLFDWLSCQSSRLPVEEFSFGPVERAELAGVGRFLSASAKTMKNISISVVDEDPPDIPEKSFDLSSLTNLETIVFGSTSTYGRVLFPGYGAMLYPWILSTLETITSTKLSSIAFVVDGRVGDLDALDTPAFDNIVLLLNTSQFKNLREVIFVVFPIRRDQIISVLKNKLIKLYSQEKLRFMLSSDWEDTRMGLPL
ncbi:hypothetical protein QCA50_006413 [Cerrena zonata]|uniref:F-box domain-containing protein n=1 Tax=Cerrena zonata TaxID=2478898 RepID=A0AAW0GDK8_9APHY